MKNQSQRPVRPPQPPYYAVVFVARLRESDIASYSRTSSRLLEKAHCLPGFFGEDAIRTPDRRVISVSYWADLETIAAWRRDLEHAAARERGRKRWYERFEVHVAKVERTESFEYEADKTLLESIFSPSRRGRDKPI